MMQTVPMKVDLKNIIEASGKMIRFWFLRYPCINMYDTYIHSRAPEFYWSKSGTCYQMFISIFYKIEK